MLQKRYQCSIDLAKNVLRLQSTEIPFLAEHELPDDLQERQLAQAEASAKTAGGLFGASAAGASASGSGSGSGSGGAGDRSVGGSSAAGPSRSSAGQSGPGSFGGAGQRLGGAAQQAPASGTAVSQQQQRQKEQGAPAGAVDAAREGRVKEDDVQTVSPNKRPAQHRGGRGVRRQSRGKGARRVK